MTIIYKVYTDGSCLGNPGAGGWCSIIITPEGREIIISGSTHGDSTTNNRMELSAVISGLRKGVPVGSRFTLYADSKYVIDCFLKKWYERWRKIGWVGIKNRDLWEDLLKLVEERVMIGSVWIKAHNGHPINERCDKIALQEAWKGKDDEQVRRPNRTL